MAATKITPKEFVAALKDWSILDVVEAVKAIEDEFGIKAAAPVAVAAVAGPAAGGEAAPAEEEQTEFTVTLTAVGGKHSHRGQAAPEPAPHGPQEGKEPGRAAAETGGRDRVYAHLEEAVVPP